MGKMMGPANEKAAKYMKEVRIPYNVRYWKPKGSMMNPNNDIDLVLVDWINYAIDQGWISVSGGGGGTNLGYTASATQGIVTSDTGNDATLPLATAANAGLHPPVPALTALAEGSVDGAADLFEIWDASASAYKKILASAVVGGGVDMVHETVTITGGNAGAALSVSATATGTTCTYASGVYTLVVPAGESIYAAHLTIVTADVQSAADAGGFTDWVRFKFDNVPGNTSLATMRVPNTHKVSIPTSGALALNNSASIKNDNNPNQSVVAVGSNSITIRFNGLVVGGQGYMVSFTGF